MSINCQQPTPTVACVVSTMTSCLPPYVSYHHLYEYPWPVKWLSQCTTSSRKDRDALNRLSCHVMIDLARYYDVISLARRVHT